MFVKSRKLLVSAVLVQVSLIGVAMGVASRVSPRSPIVGAIGLAGMASLLALASLWWAFNKSNTVFFSMFVGGILFRLVAFALFGVWVYHGAAPLLARSMVTLVLAYLVLSLMELPFFSRRAHGF